MSDITKMDMALAMKAAGKKNKEIARELGIDESELRGMLHADKPKKKGTNDKPEKSAATGRGSVSLSAAISGLNAQGMPVAEIAQAVGVSKQTVRNYLKRLGLRTNRTAGAARRDEGMRRMRADGYTVGQIAAAFGVSNNTVSSHTSDVEVTGDGTHTDVEPPNPIPERGGNAFNAARRDEAIAMLREGRGVSEVADATGCSDTTIRRYARAAGVEIPRRSTVDVAALREMRASGMGVAEIAERAGVSQNTVSRHTKDVAGGGDADGAEEALSMYGSGATVAEIAERLGVSATTVRNRLHRSCVDLGRGLTDDAIAEMRRMRAEGTPVSEIAKKSGVSVTTVLSYTAEQGREAAERKIANIRQLYAEGFSKYSIARMLGTSFATVSKNVGGVEVTGDGTKTAVEGVELPDRVSRDERIRLMCEAGHTTSEIADELGISSQTVLNHAHAMGITPRRDGSRAVGTRDVARMREMRERGESLSAIAREVGVAERTVRKYVGAAGNGKSAEDVQTMRRLYADGFRVANIARALGVSTSTVHRYVEGVEVTGDGIHTDVDVEIRCKGMFTNRQAEKVERMCAEDATTAEIAEATGLDASGVLRCAKRMGVSPRRSGTASAEDVRGMQEMRDGGATLPEIAERFGVSAATVAAHTHGTVRRIPEGEVAKMRRLRADGFRATDIARALGVSASTVRNHTADVEVTGDGTHTDVDVEISPRRRSGDYDAGLLAAVESLCAEGKSAKEIANERGVCAATVRRYAEHAGVKERLAANSRRALDERDRRMQEMRDSGMSVAEIAGRFGVSVQTVAGRTHGGHARGVTEDAVAEIRRMRVGGATIRECADAIGVSENTAARHLRGVEPEVAVRHKRSRKDAGEPRHSRFDDMTEEERARSAAGRMAERRMLRAAGDISNAYGLSEREAMQALMDALVGHGITPKEEKGETPGPERAVPEPAAPDDGFSLI